MCFEVLKGLRPMVVEREVVLVELRVVVCGGFSASVEVLIEPPQLPKNNC